MLILIANEELQKFPHDTFDNSEPPVLIYEAPYKFQLLAQNMKNYLCCGSIDGDIEQFIASGIVYEEAMDIPSGFEQRVLPPQYGIYLNQDQITTGLLLENKELTKLKDRVLLAEQTTADTSVVQQELLELLIDMEVI